jgi:hypothetical protein
MSRTTSSGPRRGVRRAAAALALAVVASGGVVVSTAGAASATNIGNQGCTPGYWKNHTSNWQEIKTTTKLGSEFTFPTELAAFRNQTFLQALQGGGGSGLSGATTILMRASAAAYLNAAHEGVGYPYRRSSAPGDLRNSINAALASKDRAKILALATKLDQANNLGCPLH